MVDNPLDYEWKVINTINDSSKESSPPKLSSYSKRDRAGEIDRLLSREPIPSDLPSKNPYMAEMVLAREILYLSLDELNEIGNKLDSFTEKR